MDAQKSLKIAQRRFQNGNYLLSLKKYGQARAEFEVALTLFEKLNSYKEIAEAINNIGMTLLKDGIADQARGFFERSYEIKKTHATATRESMFNTLYNLLSISGVMTPDEFESYFLEMKALGESLGGEYLGIVEREKQVYDSIVAQRATDLKKKQEESLARSSPTGALEHIVTAGLPCIVRAEFSVRGLAISLPEPISYLDQKKLIRIERLAAVAGPGGNSATGAVEFETSIDAAKALMEGAPAGAGRLGEEAFEHVKKFIGALALAREDIGINMNRKSFRVEIVWLKNAFGEAMEIYRGAESMPAEPVTLSSEDVMMMNVMLSSEPPVYKLLLMNARRLLDEEYPGLSVVTVTAGLDAFLDMLLRSALNSDQLLDYTSIGDCSLYDRIRFLMRLAGDLKEDEADGTLEKYLGAAGKGIEDAIECYERVIAGRSIGSDEAEKSLKAINHAVYQLKSKYGI
ncbi:MAG TPA: tetratricopeptide repeat protein [Methanocella sp.]